MPIPDQKTIDKAIAGLHLNTPYYRVEQVGKQVIFSTRDGKVTWRITVESEPSGIRLPTLRCEAKTKKGRQCRAKAVRGTNPPRCSTHRK